MPDSFKIIDTKKFMWDGETYDTKDAAEEAGNKLKESEFEVQILEEEGKFFLYNRREVKEVVGAQYGGSNIKIGFNPTYLMDVLKNLEDDDVKFEFFDVDKPAVLRKEDYIYLTLPMKI